MASVFDVAKYILRETGTITSMKLEKLAYYSQAWSLAWDGTPLFADEFEAWANGPVCPALFATHKGEFVLAPDYYDQRGNINNLSDNEKETIDSVLKGYNHFSPQELSNLTHREYPWKAARERAGVQPGYPSDEIVRKDDMQEYYGGL